MYLSNYQHYKNLFISGYKRHIFYLLDMREQVGGNFIDQRFQRPFLLGGYRRQLELL